MGKIREFFRSWFGKDRLLATGVINNGLIDPALQETFLYDFRAMGGSTNFIGGLNGIAIGSNSNTIPDMESLSRGVASAQKIKCKPIDVLNELETIPTPFSLANIDDKLAILDEKVKVIRQIYARREVSALRDRLTNRKKYAEHAAFFSGFQNTNDEKIEKLLAKYDLELHPADLFIPEMPDAAMKIIKEYREVTFSITGKNPIFYVIAPPHMFKKAYTKRDPILLVQSPFGFYWQILGAWDKEMLLLSEL